MSIATWMARELWVENHDWQRRAKNFNHAWLVHWKETQ